MGREPLSPKLFGLRWDGGTGIDLTSRSRMARPSNIVEIGDIVRMQMRMAPVTSLPVGKNADLIGSSTIDDARRAAAVGDVTTGVACADFDRPMPCFWL